MSDQTMKPLRWNPDPSGGYSVVRRPDGGLHVTFTSVSPQTVEHWRQFALEHLYNSDRLTRNLYDLRQIEKLSPEALRYAEEVVNDPSTRNIRLAVVVGNEAVRQAVLQVSALNTTPGGLELGVFTSVEEAEAWLDRPLTLLA